jgi:hypothetical protein
VSGPLAADLRDRSGVRGRRAIAATPTSDESDGDHFRAEIAAVVHTHLIAKATRLVVGWWTPTDGLRRIERE